MSMKEAVETAYLKCLSSAEKDIVKLVKNAIANQNIKFMVRQYVLEQVKPELEELDAIVGWEDLIDEHTDMIKAGVDEMIKNYLASKELTSTLTNMAEEVVKLSQQRMDTLDQRMDRFDKRIRNRVTIKKFDNTLFLRDMRKRLDKITTSDKTWQEKVREYFKKCGYMILNVLSVKRFQRTS